MMFSPARQGGRIRRSAILPTCGVLIASLVAPPPIAVRADPGGTVAQEMLQPGETCSITGRRVIGPHGENYGTIGNVLVGPDERAVSAVVKFGGFLGVGHVAVVVPWSHLHFSAAAGPDAPVMLDLTPDELRNSPEYRPSVDLAAAVEC